MEEFGFPHLTKALKKGRTQIYRASFEISVPDLEVLLPFQGRPYHSEYITG